MFNRYKNINTYVVALFLLLVLFVSGCEDETPTEQVIPEEIDQPVRSASTYSFPVSTSHNGLTSTLLLRPPSQSV